MDLFHPSGHGRRRRRKTTHYAEGLIEVSGDGSFSLSSLLPGHVTTHVDSQNQPGSFRNKVRNITNSTNS